MVVITNNATNQAGALWTRGKVDLRNPFEYRSYLYWGRSVSRAMGSAGSQVGGDGMTFTIQNDPRGTSAVGGNGGALGAYNRSPVAGVANAISFEVDPYINGGGGDYDAGMSINTGNINASRHFAFIKPTDPIGQAKHFSLRSFNDISFPDSQWVPFIADWFPQDDGSGRLVITVNGVEVSYTIANYNSYFGGNFAHLGYTGATGTASALQAVAIENLPTLSYTLSFNGNGGDASAITAQTIDEGALATEPAFPTRPGFSFAGWNTASDGSGDIWNFSTSTMPQGNLTLFAQWTNTPFTLSFDTNSGSTAPANQQLFYGDAATEPTAPTKTGYTFKTWNTAANGSGQTWNFTTSRMPGQNTILYAQYDQNLYTLSFDGNGATSTTPPAQQLTYDSLATAPEDPIRQGHQFLGWNETLNGTGNTWDFGTSRMPDRAVTLFAQWQKNAYTVTFESNGGSTVPDQTVLFDNFILKPTSPSRSGYQFSGWYADKELTNLWDFTGSAVVADMTLYAKWIDEAILPNITVPTFTEIKVGGSFDPKSNLKASSASGQDLTSQVTIQGSFDTKKPGIYLIRYDVKDAQGNSAQTTQVLLVNDGNYVRENNTIIYATDFTIPLSEAKLSDAQMIQKANVLVFDLESNSYVSNPQLTLDRSKYQVKVGKYPVTFTSNPSRTITVTVTGAVLPAKTGEASQAVSLVAALLLGGMAVTAGLIFLRRKGNTSTL